MIDRFEEFKLFSEITHQLSERRQATTQTYLGANTVIFTVLAFLVKDAGFRGLALVAVTLPLFAVGLTACFVWLRILANYEKVIGWHYEQLRGMEGCLDGSRKVYTLEWEEFYQPRAGKSRTVFSHLEADLPKMFMALYIVYAAGLVLATALGLLK